MGRALRVLYISPAPHPIVLALPSARYAVEHASSVRALAEAVPRQTHDVFLVEAERDASITTGLLRTWAAPNPEIPFVVLTSHVAPMRRDAMRNGASKVLSREKLTDTSVMEALEQSVELAMRRAELRSRRSAKRVRPSGVRTFSDRLQDGVIIHDAQGRIVEANQGACVDLDYTRDELLGLTVFDVIGRPSRDEFQALWSGMSTERVMTVGIEQIRRDGRRVAAKARISAFADSASQRYLLLIPSEQQAVELPPNLLTDGPGPSDPVTGLPSVKRFLEVIRLLGDAAIVLVVDIDGFRGISGSLGSDIGDRVLRQVGQSLRRVTDRRGMVTRVTADEFAVVDPGVLGAETLIQRVRDALDQPVHAGDTELYLTGSIGIARARDIPNPDSLLHAASIAANRAREMGRGGTAWYSAEMHARATERIRFQSDLWRALDRGELRLRYQPIVSLETGRMVGVEALIRWHHPQLGLVHPDRFIPVAEETGAILPIGAWVLRTACAQLAAWERQLNETELTVSVNLSADQFADPSFVGEVADVLRETGLDAHRLKLEITETVLMGNPEISRSTLEQLRALGVRIVVDDFGTGYSSLAFLQRFPVDELKIDRSFVDEEGELTLVPMIVALARTLELRATAEGVENAGQLSMLRALRCDLAQGFLFAKSLDDEGVVELLRSTQEFF